MTASTAATATAAAGTTGSGRRTSAAAALALVAVTAVWGSTFTLSKDLLRHVAVLDYLGLRFLVAAGVLALARPAAVRRLDRRTALLGVALGLMYAVAQVLQYAGLRHSSPTVAAFVVAMYVVFTPLLSAGLLHRRPDRASLLATVLATVGVAAMSLRGWSPASGELLTLLAALLYAVHILAMGRWASRGRAFELAFVQLLTMGVGLTALAAPGGLDLPRRADLGVFLYLAVGAAALTLLVQTWAQGHVDPARTAVLMVLEPVWAAVFAAVIWHEHLGVRTVVGGVLVLAAMLTVISRPGARPEAPAPAHP